MKTSSKIWMCLTGVALVALGILCIMYPGSTLLSLSWVFGCLFFLGGIGYFVKVAVVNKVEKRFVRLRDRLHEVVDIDWEDVK